MGTRDLTYEVMAGMQDRIDLIRDTINTNLVNSGFQALDTGQLPVWLGERVSTKFPHIIVRDGNKTIERFAMTTTQDTYNMQIDVVIQQPTTRGGKEEQYLKCIAGAIQTWLNSRNNRQFVVPKTSISVFDSGAPMIELGTYANTGSRVARISWWGKILNPDGVS